MRKIDFEKFFIFLTCINKDGMRLSEIGRAMNEYGGVAYCTLFTYFTVAKDNALLSTCKRNNYYHTLTLTPLGKEYRKWAYNMLKLDK